ncbi:hypothetical protein Sta7437_2228 [Stanieria cyanosphaera PCC 7437]|uniref:Sulfotransferase domain-containing protein n=1 Tax=Stanieria cyanosphaera (strain ATCC 29371 / PCC 7437) TaxID=111780 RepID=K9XUM1_STAC7|nr:sulfotransferase domain-containing protein [Stanieria cyanosphaera]AFZ35776.1 hypothetical protein Sta7437_2228 [Stanieria cyanosphaera PCC 7437]
MNLIKKVLLRPTLDHILNYWGSNNAKNYDLKNTIAIACSGRGGSTWLTEIIGTLPGYPILWEPLHLAKNPECKNYGYNWNTYIPYHAEDNIKKNYLEQILIGQNLSTNIISSLAFHPQKFFNFQGFLVKFVNANLLFNWMLKQFPIQGILMIRHPCAVVESQLRHSAWNHINKNNLTFPQQLTVDYPHLVQIFETIQTREEILAFEWAIQTYIPLIQPKSKFLYIITYEKLINESKLEINRLFNYLGKPVPKSAYEKLKQVSKTTQQVSNVTHNKNVLTGWKERLLPQQIDNILNIVHQVGINFYNDSLIPDYKNLSDLVNQS